MILYNIIERKYNIYKVYPHFPFIKNAKVKTQFLYFAAHLSCK